MESHPPNSFTNTLMLISSFIDKILKIRYKTDKDLSKTYHGWINTSKNNDALWFIHSVRECNL